MRISKIFFKSAKEDSRDVELPSQNFLIRAGYFRPLAVGIFTYLHFGQRSLSKIARILREEMDAIGGDEIIMPVVHPADIWKKTNRWYEIDDSLVRFRDRSGRDLVLAMTHEEVVAHLCVSEIDSYKQLPKLVYQVNTKFRDEARSRGGLIRAREFTMKDAYSLDRDEAGLEKQYVSQYESYFRIFARAGLPVVAILSDTGMMGGKMAHEYMYLTPIGEDTVFISDDYRYKANKEIAGFKKDLSPRPTAALEKIYTPGARTIAELAAMLEADSKDLCKAVFFTVSTGSAGKDGIGKRATGQDGTGQHDTGEGDPRKDETEKGDIEKIVLVLVNGHLEVNTAKLEKILRTDKYRPSTPEEIIRIGAVPGYASAIGIDRSKSLVIADDQVAIQGNLIAGANEEGYHLRNVCYGRDFSADIVTDITNAYDGALSPHENTTRSLLHSVRGIEVGNIFQLGTKYTEATGAVFTDEDGVRKPIVMGSYGIGVGRMLACLAEEHHDEKGLCLPVSVAPYQAVLVSLPDTPEVVGAADLLYSRLKEAGVEVLYDDRDPKTASAGMKFADADLIGIPVRITISKRSLKNGGAEIKLRRAAAADLPEEAPVEKRTMEAPAAEIVAMDQVATRTRALVDGLFKELESHVQRAEKWPG